MEIFSAYSRRRRQQQTSLALFVVAGQEKDVGRSSFTLIGCFFREKMVHVRRVTVGDVGDGVVVSVSVSVSSSSAVAGALLFSFLLPALFFLLVLFGFVGRVQIAVDSTLWIDYVFMSPPLSLVSSRLVLSLFVLFSFSFTFSFYSAQCHRNLDFKSFGSSCSTEPLLFSTCLSTVSTTATPVVRAETTSTTVRTARTARTTTTTTTICRVALVECTVNRHIEPCKVSI